MARISSRKSPGVAGVGTIICPSGTGSGRSGGGRGWVSHSASVRGSFAGGAKCSKLGGSPALPARLVCAGCTDAPSAARSDCRGGRGGAWVILANLSLIVLVPSPSIQARSEWRRGMPFGIKARISVTERWFASSSKSWSPSRRVKSSPCSPSMNYTIMVS